MKAARNRTPPKTTLKIFQANVDKGEEAHSAALQLAFQEGYNIVLIQEPNTSYNAHKDLCRTQHHPGFLCFSPVDSWNNNLTRPRVLTYVRIDRKIHAEQLLPARHRRPSLGSSEWNHDPQHLQQTGGRNLTGHC